VDAIPGHDARTSANSRLQLAAMSEQGRKALYADLKAMGPADSCPLVSVAPRKQPPPQCAQFGLSQR